MAGEQAGCDPDGARHLAAAAVTFALTSPAAVPSDASTLCRDSRGATLLYTLGRINEIMRRFAASPHAEAQPDPAAIDFSQLTQQVANSCLSKHHVCCCSRKAFNQPYPPPYPPPPPRRSLIWCGVC